MRREFEAAADCANKVVAPTSTLVKMPARLAALGPPTPRTPVPKLVLSPRTPSPTSENPCTPPPEDTVHRVDHIITTLTGAEAIAGSTRLKAGTATKMVLNTISTGVMIQLGKVYGNRMIDVAVTIDDPDDSTDGRLMDGDDVLTNSCGFVIWGIKP